MENRNRLLLSYDKNKGLGAIFHCHPTL